jgi:hypothetical protein
MIFWHLQRRINMGTWQAPKFESPPQTQDVEELRRYIKYLVNLIALMAKDLDFTLNGDITFKNVRAKSLTADRLDVDELSAITANLGEITAGVIRGIEIYGSLISTNETGYPKAEMSVSDNLFRVALDEDNTLVIRGDYLGTPAIYFTSPANNYLFYMSDTRSDIGSLQPLRIESGAEIILEPNTGTVTVPNWSKLKNVATGRTLQQELDDIYSAMAGKSDVGHTHTVTTTAGGGTFTTSS